MSDQQKTSAITGISQAAINAIGDPHTRNVINALLQAHNVRNGIAGNGKERFITAGELSIFQGKVLSAVGDAQQAQSGAHALFLDVDRIVNDAVAQVIASQLFSDLAQRVQLIDAPRGAIAQLNQALIAAADLLRGELARTASTLQDGITQINTISNTSTSYAAQQLNAIKATVYDPTGALPLASSAILALNDVSATSTSANARQLAGMVAKVTNQGSGLDAAVASIGELNNVSVTSGSANAKKLAGIDAQVNDPNTGLAKARADIVELNNVDVNSTSASARRLAGLFAQVNDVTSGLPRAMALIAEDGRAIAEQRSALVERTNAIYSALDTKNRTFFASTAPINGMVAGDVWYNTNDNNSPHRWSGSAWVSAADPRVARIEGGIVDEVRARLQQDNAIVSAIQTVWGALGGNSGLIQGGSRIEVNTGGAVAGGWNQVQAALRDSNGTLISSATIKQTTEALVDRSGRVEAKWVVNLDAGGNAIGFRQAGFGISGSSSSNGPTYAFGIRADKVWIAAPGDSANAEPLPGRVPFIVKTAPWIDGQGYQQPPGVYITETFITTAKIGVAQIKSAMIGNAEINTLKLAGNTVTVPLYLSGNGGVGNINPGNLFQVSSVVGWYADVVDIVAIVSWQAAAPGQATNTRVEIWADGAPMLMASDSAPAGMAMSHVATAKARLGAGSHTFTLHFGNDWNANYWQLGNWSVTLLGVMR